LQFAVCPTLEGYLEPFDQKRRFSVRPLLTPENYHEHVLGLIDGVKEVAAPLPTEQLADIDHLSVRVHEVQGGYTELQKSRNRLSTGVYGCPRKPRGTYAT
jgi:hypothetical protein